MNVSELFNLTHWISKEIEDALIPKKYQTLQAILQQHAQPNQQKQPFESQKDTLTNALSNVPLARLTRDQLDFLYHLGIAEAVGEEGVATIEDLLYRNVIDVATSAQKLQRILQKLNEGINKSNQIKAGLTGCVLKEEYEAEDQILMRVSFTGHAVMANVADFKSWGGIWYDIGRGIAMAHNSSPEDVRIVGATKGSIIIELAVACSIATTTSGIILSALKVAEKVLDIKRKAEELRGLKLRNNKFAKDLENEAENEKKAGIEEITSEVAKQLELKDGEGDKVKALDTSVKNLVNFIEKGGIVDFVMPDEEEEHEEDKAKKNAALRLAFQQIRKLEKKLALLEHREP